MNEMVEALQALSLWTWLRLGLPKGGHMCSTTDTADGPAHGSRAGSRSCVFHMMGTINKIADSTIMGIQATNRFWHLWPWFLPVAIRCHRLLTTSILTTAGL